MKRNLMYLLCLFCLCSIGLKAQNLEYLAAPDVAQGIYGQSIAGNLLTNDRYHSIQQDGIDAKLPAGVKIKAARVVMNDIFFYSEAKAQNWSGQYDYTENNTARWQLKNDAEKFFSPDIQISQRSGQKYYHKLPGNTYMILYKTDGKAYRYNLYVQVIMYEDGYYEVLSNYDNQRENLWNTFINTPGVDLSKTKNKVYQDFPITIEYEVEKPNRNGYVQDNAMHRSFLTVAFADALATKKVTFRRFASVAEGNELYICGGTVGGFSYEEEPVANDFSNDSVGYVPEIYRIAAQNSSEPQRVASGTGNNQTTTDIIDRDGYYIYPSHTKHYSGFYTTGGETVTSDVIQGKLLENSGLYKDNNQQPKMLSFYQALPTGGERGAVAYQVIKRGDYEELNIIGGFNQLTPVYGQNYKGDIEVVGDLSVQADGSYSFKRRDYTPRLKTIEVIKPQYKNSTDVKIKLVKVDDPSYSLTRKAEIDSSEGRCYIKDSDIQSLASYLNGRFNVYCYIDDNPHNPIDYTTTELVNGVDVEYYDFRVLPIYFYVGLDVEVESCDYADFQLFVLEGMAMRSSLTIDALYANYEKYINQSVSEVVTPQDDVVALKRSTVATGRLMKNDYLSLVMDNSGAEDEYSTIDNNVSRYVIGNSTVDMTINYLGKPATTIQVPVGENKQIEGVGTIKINADGQYTFTPEPAFVGNIDIVYSVKNTCNVDNGGNVDILGMSVPFFKSTSLVDNYTYATLRLAYYPDSDVNMWVGGYSTDFNDAKNWSLGRKWAVGDDMIMATADNNNGAFAKNDIVIAEGSTIKVGKLENETKEDSNTGEKIQSIIIPKNTMMIVTGEPKGFEKLTAKDKLWLKSQGAQQDGQETYTNASIVFEAGNACNFNVNARVDMYSRAKEDKTRFVDNDPASPDYCKSFTQKYAYQFFGSPINISGGIPTSKWWIDGTKLPDNYNDYQFIKFSGSKGLEISARQEKTNNPYHFYQKWTLFKSNWGINFNEGYRLGQKEPSEYAFRGKLLLCPFSVNPTRMADEVTASSARDEKVRRHELGQNIYANPFTAAIDLTKSNLFHKSDKLEKTVYLYHTGGISAWQAQKGNSNTAQTAYNPGEYTAIVANVESTLWPKAQIPSMQGFMVKYTPAETLYSTDKGAELRFEYSGLAKNEYSQKAPAERDNTGYMRVELSSATTADAILLVENDECSPEFDNGWEAFRQGRSFNSLFVESKDGDMQISSDRSMVGRYISIVVGDEAEYTLTLTKDNLAHYSDLCLVDLATGSVVELSDEETSYTFAPRSKRGVVEKRFVLARIGETTGSDLKEQYNTLNAYIDGNSLVVSNFTSLPGEATIYDIAGRLVFNAKFPQDISTISLPLPQGVYMVRLAADNTQNTVKVVLK